jgi:hypothetical protein
MKNNVAKPVVGIVLSILCVLLLIGIATFAGPCGVHDDGSVSSCHWAARAVLGVGVVALVLSAVRIFERDEGERRGLDLGVAATGALVAFLPGGLIDLCMMQTMRCHTIMRPFCMGVGVVIALVAAGDLVMRLFSLRKS